MTRLVLDTYLDLCTQFYDLSKPKPPEDAYALYKSYAAAAKGKILEPMCGTGRFLLPLLAEGFDVEGFDASEHMLNALHAKAKSSHPKVWKGFVEDLNKSDRYDLIFIPSGSFGLITDLNAAKSALKIFHKHLDNDGVLVFEAETLKAAPTQAGIWRGSVVKKNEKQMIIGSFLDLPLIDNIGAFIAKYELVDENRIIQAEAEEYKIKFYDPQTMLDMLKGAGFSNINLIKTFDRAHTPEADDEMIIYECKK